MTQTGTIYFYDREGRLLLEKRYQTKEFRNQCVKALLERNTGLFAGCSVVVAPRTMPRVYDEVKGTIKALDNSHRILQVVSYSSKRERNTVLRSLMGSWGRRLKRVQIAPTLMEYSRKEVVT